MSKTESSGAGATINVSTSTTDLKKDIEEGLEEMVTKKKSFLRQLAERMGLAVDDDTDLADIDTAMSMAADIGKLMDGHVEKGTTDSPEATEGGKMPDIDLTKVDEDVAAYITALEAERDEALAKASDDNDEGDDVLKAASPEILEFIQKTEARAVEAETIAKAEREMRLQREYLEKAQSIPYFGEERDEVASVVREMAEKLAPETFAKVDTMLKAANAQIAESTLFMEAGLAGQGVTGDAYQQLEGIAKQYRESNPELSEEAAFDKALSERPDLYERYQDEHRQEA